MAGFFTNLLSVFVQNVCGHCVYYFLICNINVTCCVSTGSQLLTEAVFQ